MNDKKTILVVEDNALNMKLVVDLLELNGFCVLKAPDSSSALDILETTVPDLILLDIGLPDMDGFEVLNKIRENRKPDTVKVAALTASVMDEDKKRVREAGFDALIAKPIDTKEFIKTVRALVEAQR